MRAFELLCLFLIHTSLGVCFNIVKDFRVKSMSKTSSSAGTKSNNGNKLVGNIGGGTETTTTQAVSLLSSVPESSPTIAISDTVQIVHADDSNSFYYIEMTLEDSKTDYESTFPFLLDTGSSLCWIYNSSCSENGCDDSSIKKFSDSRTLTSFSTFGLSYSGEEVSGDLINLKSNDLLITVNDLTIDEFAMGFTNNSPSAFDNLNISGLVGISSSTDNKENWLYQLYSQDIIDTPVFGLCLLDASHINYVNSSDDNVDLPSGYGGLMILGSDAQNFTDDIVYTNIIDNDNSYWLLNITDIQVNDGNTTRDFNDTINYREALIDTGTTGIALPLDDAESLMSEVFGSDLISDGKGNYAFPCTLTDNEVILTIGNKEFIVLSECFMGSEYTSSSLEGYCASKLQGFDSSYWVLGATFIENYYTIFDLENNRIGLGEFSFSMFKLVSEGNSETTTKGNTVHTTTNKSSTSTHKSKGSHSTSSHSSSINSSSQSTSHSANFGSHLYSFNFVSIESAIIYISISLLTIF